MRSPSSILWLALLWLTPGLSAQEAPPSAGEQIRVTTDHGEILMGRWERASADSVWLTIGTWSTGLDRSALRSVERSSGIGREVDVPRLAFVAAGFAVLGGVIGAAEGPCTSDEFLGCMFAPTTRRGAIQLGAAGGLLVGLGVGALVSVQRTERWNTVGGFGPESTSLEIHPVVGPRSGVAFSLRPGRR